MVEMGSTGIRQNPYPNFSAKATTYEHFSSSPKTQHFQNQYSYDNQISAGWQSDIHSIRLRYSPLYERLVSSEVDTGMRGGSLNSNQRFMPSGKPLTSLHGIESQYPDKFTIELREEDKESYESGWVSFGDACYGGLPSCNSHQFQNRGSSTLYNLLDILTFPCIPNLSSYQLPTIQHSHILNIEEQYLYQQNSAHPTDYTYEHISSLSAGQETEDDSSECLHSIFRAADIGLTYSEQMACPPPNSHHEPISDDHRSSYSELSAHVAYFSQLSETSRSISKHTTNCSSPVVHESTCYQLPLPTSQAQGSSAPNSLHMDNKIPSSSPEPDEAASELLSPLASKSIGRSKFSLKELSGRKRSDEKKPLSLACFFCRERKIACGRPEEGNMDMACNQCARRAYLCEYPKESHRGQHKRGVKRLDNLAYRLDRVC